MPDRRRTAKELTKDEIKIESTITSDDVQAARQWWKAHAPGQFKEILDAEKKPETTS